MTKKQGEAVAQKTARHTPGPIKKIDRLKQEAKKACEWRGHRMGKWVAYSSTTYGCRCLTCEKAVVVNSRPMPNEIDIGGEAVALGCED